jgi:hypothetical protein
MVDWDLLRRREEMRGRPPGRSRKTPTQHGTCARVDYRRHCHQDQHKLRAEAVPVLLLRR